MADRSQCRPFGVPPDGMDYKDYHIVPVFDYLPDGSMDIQWQEVISYGPISSTDCDHMTADPHILNRLRTLAAEFTAEAGDTRHGNYFDGMRQACRHHALRLQDLIRELEGQQ